MAVSGVIFLRPDRKSARTDASCRAYGLADLPRQAVSRDERLRATDELPALAVRKAACKLWGSHIQSLGG